MSDYVNASDVPWYSYRAEIEKVSIGSGVTNIGNNAFNGCANLTGATIAASVTAIGNYAFSNCANLALTALPSGVTTIGRAAFDSCTGLVRLSLPASLTTMGIGVFSACSGLKTLVFKGNAPTVSMSAFIGMANSGTLDYPSTADYSGVTAPALWAKTAYTVDIFTARPAPQSVLAGADATFSVAGSDPILPTDTTYRWQESANSGANWSDISNTGIYSGATTATLALTGVTLAENGNQYRCVAENAVYLSGVESGLIQHAGGQRSTHGELRARRAWPGGAQCHVCGRKRR